MPSFKEFVSGKEQKKPVSTGGFSAFLKSQAPTKLSTKEQAKANVLADPKNHVFNPLNPASKELNIQLDQRAPSTSVARNFLPALGGAFKEAGKIALELPKGIVEPYINPSETERQLEANMPNKGIGKVASILAKPIFRTFEPIVESLGTQIGTAIGTKGKVLPSANDAFLAGGSFGLGAAGSFNVGGKAGKLTKDVVPDRVVQTVNTKTGEKTYYTIPKVESKTIIDKIDNSGGLIPKDSQGNNFHVTAKTPAQMEAQGFKNGGAIAANKIPEPVKKELTYKPIEQPVINTPEIKVSKLAQGVESKAVAKKLTDGFGDLPEYAKVNVKDQANAATNLIKTNREQAINIAMGRELPPEGLLPESVFTAIEDHAIKTKDVALLRDLATSSTLTSEATGMGQRIRMLAERNPNSAVSTMKKVMKLREEVATRKFGDVKKARAKVTAEIASEVKKAAPKAKDWNSFISEITCK